MKPIGKLLHELHAELAHKRVCPHCGGYGTPRLVDQRGAEAKVMENGCPQCGRVSRGIILEDRPGTPPGVAELPAHA